MKIGVIGLGLIGGSIFKRGREKHEMVGVSRSVKEECVSNDYASLKGCDLVFVCTPMNKTLEILDKLENFLDENTIVTDVCSLKEFVSKKNYKFKFIPSHPMAGTEHSGWEHSFPELFEGATWAITLKDDSVTSILNFNESDNKYLAIVTDKGTGKRMHLKDFDKTTRARRGLLTIRDVKTNPYHVVAAFFLSPKEEIGLKNGEITYYKGSDLTIADRYSTGSTLRKGGVDTAFKVVELNDINNQEEIEVLEVEKPDLEKLDARLMTIDDFLNDNN